MFPKRELLYQKKLTMMSMLQMVKSTTKQQKVEYLINHSLEAVKAVGEVTT